MSLWSAALLLLPLAAVAQDDPLKSPACAAALAQLQDARTEAARQQAVLTCLGGTGATTPRSNRWAQPPVVVPAPAIEPPGPRAAAAQPRAIPPPVAIERPAAPSLCDATGCWTSDGTRLQRVPPQLYGPGGACVLQAGILLCP